MELLNRSHALLFFATNSRNLEQGIGCGHNKLQEQVVMRATSRLNLQRGIVATQVTRAGCNARNITPELATPHCCDTNCGNLLVDLSLSLYATGRRFNIANRRCFKLLHFPACNNRCKTPPPRNAFLGKLLYNDTSTLFWLGAFCHGGRKISIEYIQ